MEIPLVLQYSLVKVKKAKLRLVIIIKIIKIGIAVMEIYKIKLRALNLNNKYGKSSQKPFFNK